MSSGWYARRRGILDHLENGTISLVDAAVHDFLCLTCDYRTGVARSSAAKIHALCPGDLSYRSIKYSLAKLERIGWIKRWIVRGKKGNYPVLISRFYVRDASLIWWSVNAERTTDWRKVQFDAVLDGSPDHVPEPVPESVPEPVPEDVRDPVREVSPVQEGITKKEEKNNEEGEGLSSRFYSLTKNRILAIYQKTVQGKAITWREAEKQALMRLLQGHDSYDVLRAYCRYLSTADAWDRERGFPFCSFAQKMSEYLLPDDDEDETWVTVDDIRPPGYVPPVKTAGSR